MKLIYVLHLILLSYTFSYQVIRCNYVQTRYNSINADSISIDDSIIIQTDTIAGASSRNSNVGRPHTDISKAKISSANKGKTPWNAGKRHSEDTKARISAKTREAFERKKLLKAQELGLTLEQYEESKLIKKVEDRKQKLKGGLTPEGRSRISASLKERWNDPEYRRLYTANSKGNRNHSDVTRARISEAIKTKWTDPQYRSKISIPPSPEVRARISATLKNKWEQPEFREKMISSQGSRSVEWRLMISEKIREKWNDPSYRNAVETGMKNSNRTSTYTGVRKSSGRRSSSRLSGVNSKEVAERRKQAKIDKAEKNRLKRETVKLAKKVTKESQSKGQVQSIKQLLGGELWFEEKMKRTKKGEMMMDDESLEKEISAEWEKNNEDMDEYGGSFDSEEGSDEDDDDDYDSDDMEMSQDVIEVYDEDGELIGTYTEAEFARLQQSKKQ